VAKASFDGCSTGGRQGLVSAQRFPDDFDGIVVGAPVLNFVDTMVSSVGSQRALTRAPLTPAHPGAAVGGRHHQVRRGGRRDRRRHRRPAALRVLPRHRSARVRGRRRRQRRLLHARAGSAIDEVMSGVTRKGATVCRDWPVGTETVAAVPGSGARSA
jgi:feruloyl esterase